MASFYAPELQVDFVVRAINSQNKQHSTLPQSAGCPESDGAECSDATWTARLAFSPDNHPESAAERFCAGLELGTDIEVGTEILAIHNYKSSISTSICSSTALSIRSAPFACICRPTSATIPISIRPFIMRPTSASCSAARTTR